MTKIHPPISTLSFLLLFFFLKITAAAQNNYLLLLKGIDKDSAYLVDKVGIRTNFSSQMTCVDYIGKLPALLQTKGYVTASIDSVKFDSSFARLVIFLGEAYQWLQLKTDGVDQSILDAVG